MKRMPVKSLTFSIVVLSMVLLASVALGWPEGFPNPSERVDQNGMPMETIYAQRMVSPQIKTLHTNFNLPPQHHLLIEAKPFVRLFTINGEIAKHEIKDAAQEISLNGKMIDGDELYAEVGLFYCRDGDLGLCLFKKLLYVYGVNRSSPIDKLELSYSIQEEY